MPPIFNLSYKENKETGMLGSMY